MEVFSEEFIYKKRSWEARLNPPLWITNKPGPAYWNCYSAYSHHDPFNIHKYQVIIHSWLVAYLPSEKWWSEFVSWDYELPNWMDFFYHSCSSHHQYPLNMIHKYPSNLPSQAGCPAIARHASFGSTSGKRGNHCPSKKMPEIPVIRMACWWWIVVLIVVLIVINSV